MIANKIIIVVSMMLSLSAVYGQEMSANRDTILILKRNEPIFSENEELVFLSIPHTKGFCFQEATIDKARMIIMLMIPQKNYKEVDGCRIICSNINFKILSIEKDNGDLLFSHSDTTCIMTITDSNNILEYLNREIELLLKDAIISYCYESEYYPESVLFYLSTPLLQSLVKIRK